MKFEGQLLNIHIAPAGGEAMLEVQEATRAARKRERSGQRLFRYRLSPTELALTTRQLATLIASAAAFAPSQQSTSSTALAASPFAEEIGAEIPTASSMFRWRSVTT